MTYQPLEPTLHLNLSRIERYKSFLWSVVTHEQSHGTELLEIATALEQVAAEAREISAKNAREKNQSDIAFSTTPDPE